MCGDSADYIGLKIPYRQLENPPEPYSRITLSLAGVNALCFQLSEFRVPSWIITTHSVSGSP